MISYHNRIKGATINPYGFIPCNYKNIKELWNVVGSYTWSPAIFKDNYRLGKNFLFCDVLGLDFDGGYTIEQAIEDFAGFKMLIGTTKSHMLPKNQEPALPRFRLIIPWERRITDGSELEYNIKLVANTISHSDESCHERARQFYPCQNLHYISLGDHLPVYQKPPDIIAAEEQRDKILRYKQSLGIIPKHVQDFIETGKPFGKGRNKSLYVTGQYLLCSNNSFPEVEKMMRSIPFDRTGFSNKELDTVIESLRKQARNLDDERR